MKTSQSDILHRHSIRWLFLQILFLVMECRFILYLIYVIMRQELSRKHDVYHQALLSTFRTMDCKVLCMFSNHVVNLGDTVSTIAFSTKCQSLDWIRELYRRSANFAAIRTYRQCCITDTWRRRPENRDQSTLTEWVRLTQ